MCNRNGDVAILRQYWLIILVDSKWRIFNFFFSIVGNVGNGNLKNVEYLHICICESMKG